MTSSKSARWGLYPWFEERGANLIHPDDLTAVRALVPSGKVFRIAGDENEFIRLSYGNKEFRALPSLFQEVLFSIREIGETVTLKDGRKAEVIGINWHHQRGEPMYQVRIDGKNRSNRYWNSDFDPS